MFLLVLLISTPFFSAIVKSEDVKEPEQNPVTMLRTTLKTWHNMYNTYRDEMNLGYCWADYFMDIGKIIDTLTGPRVLGTDPNDIAPVKVAFEQLLQPNAPRASSAPPQMILNTKDLKGTTTKTVTDVPDDSGSIEYYRDDDDGVVSDSEWDPLSDGSVRYDFPNRGSTYPEEYANQPQQYKYEIPPSYQRSLMESSPGASQIRRRNDSPFSSISSQESDHMKPFHLIPKRNKRTVKNNDDQQQLPHSKINILESNHMKPIHLIFKRDEETVKNDHDQQHLQHTEKKNQETGAEIYESNAQENTTKNDSYLQSVERSTTVLKDQGERSVMAISKARGISDVIISLFGLNLPPGLGPLMLGVGPNPLTFTVVRLIGTFMRVGRQVIATIDSTSILSCTKDYLLGKMMIWIDS